MSNTGNIQKIDVSAIVADGQIQMREKMSREAIEDYADVFDCLPPLQVVYDGSMFWLVDGFHRLEAAKLAGIERVTCQVVDGTRRDAVIMACGANAAHGLRRTNADKRRAVLTLLEDEEWSKMSNRKIAECVGLNRRLVDKIRNEIKQANERSELKVDGGLIEDADDGGDVEDEPSLDTDDEWEDVEDEGEVEIEPLIDDKHPWKKNIKTVDMFRVRVLELIRDIDGIERMPGTERLYGSRKILIRDLTSLKNNIAGCIPSHTCPYCHGHDEDCPACKGRGWLASHEYNQVPEDIRNEAERLSTGGGE